MSTNLREKLSKLPMTWTQIEAVLQALSETGHLLCAEDVEKIAEQAVRRALESNSTSAGHAAQGDPASGVHAALQETARGTDILAAEAKPDSHSVGRSSGVGGEVLNSASASGAEGGGGVGAVPSPSPARAQQDLDAHWRSMWAQSEERVRELAREEARLAVEKLKHPTDAPLIHLACDVRQKAARDAALEEAAQLCERPSGLDLDNDVGTTRSNLARSLRALKSRSALALVKPASEVRFDKIETRWCPGCTSTLRGHHMLNCELVGEPFGSGPARRTPETGLDAISDFVNCTDTAENKLANIRAVLLRHGRNPVEHKEPELDESKSLFPGHVRALQSEIDALKKERDELRTKLAESDKALDEIAEHLCAGADPSIDHRTCICEILQRMGCLVQIRNPATILGGPPSERPSGTTPAPAQEPADRSLGTKG